MFSLKWTTLTIALVVLWSVNAEEKAKLRTETTTSLPSKHHTETEVPKPKEVETPLVVGKLEVVDYNVTKDKIKCVRAAFAAELQISYRDTVTNKSVTAAIPLSKKSVVDDHNSMCENVSKLVININGEQLNTLELDILEKSDNKSYYVSNVVVNLDVETIRKLLPNAPNQSHIEAAYSDRLFETPIGKSYYCESEDTLQMKSANGSEFQLKVLLEKFRLDAFRSNTKDDFSEAQECSVDNKPNDIIPIAVGAALAALVVIVLIAYFIGRSRSRRLAYQSV